VRFFVNSYRCAAVIAKISTDSESRGPSAIAELRDNTVTDTVTHLVNVKRGAHILQDWTSLVHTVDCVDSRGWFSCDTSVPLNH